MVMYYFALSELNPCRPHTHTHTRSGYTLTAMTRKPDLRPHLPNTKCRLLLSSVVFDAVLLAMVVYGFVSPLLWSVGYNRV